MSVHILGSWMGCLAWVVVTQLWACGDAALEYESSFSVRGNYAITGGPGSRDVGPSIEGGGGPKCRFTGSPYI